MKKTLISMWVLAGWCAGASAVVAGTGVDLQVGQDMYDQLCVMCHASGIDGAPRLGEKEDWLKRLPMGEDTLVKAVIEGPNHMYSKGGGGVESEGQIRSMVAYMMGTVTDADTQGLIDTASAAEKARHLAIVRGYKLYDQVCFNCHDKGELGAPRIGESGDWVERKQRGIESLVDSAVAGKNHMYMRAMTAVPSRADFKSMVEYMLSTTEDSGKAEAKAPAKAAQ